MNIKIMPTKLSGRVTVPPSKSVAHRMIIAAALADGESVIDCLYPSADILATIDAMRGLGADIEYKDGKAVVRGIEKSPESAVLDCCESGSTLRFLIPVAAALGVNAEYHGRAKLPQRPITPYLEEFPKHGVKFDYPGTMPFSTSGKLNGGKFYISGGISSQFITGLLLALPILSEDSEIVLTSRLESKPYVDITLGVLRDFGCEIKETATGYFVKGGQRYKPFSGSVEGDYSQAAFFEVANAIGSRLEITGLNEKSSQGDKKIVEICREMVYNKGMALKPFEIDCSDVPDLVPILAVLGCFCNGKSRIYNAARLRIKECDRLAVITECLNALGGKITEHEDSLEIEGVESLHGGVIDSHTDHRIPMAIAVASTRCTEPVTILGAECVSKSYPDFWEVFSSVGGSFEKV